MGSRKTNARGRQLQEVINEGYIDCIDDISTTFEKNDYEEKIDWILVSQPLYSLISNVEAHPIIGTISGHELLTFDIPIGIEPKPASPRISNITAAIEIENTLSRSFNLNSDTRQGSPLSPLLYIICAADSMNGIPQHTEYGLFADNTALWTSSNTITSLSSKLQQSVDEFQSWCKSWKLKLQPTKTKLIYFTIHPQKSLRIDSRSIIIYDYPILPTANDQIWEKLQIMQNKAIHAALGLPIYTSVDYIHKLINILKIKEYAVTLLQSYTQTASSNNDQLLKTNLQEIANKL
ncbi:unnamed protein product [Rotaria magnacalcarata]|uniref:Reverse transcriptase domain-containing protein n=1 Tax=Rotaria magnacalcarata TaxID=392030 RepID=A0A819RS98_9BILA|nr:unnamed protein product [Rotaria magnacalcarata]CAF4048414.1 unnamed protein product [Rotaria magnacalcarata]